ncbi:CBS domain-containing protein [Nitrospirillum viridazoti Y2]|uniref:CBS domain-containing protein n=1 Tax=Nitrospirillum amazonense TaxID=28077 RepID=A0A560HPY3_9PROT|nr:CBS domain-containing protein [Nitrospirillum amazonense]EGY02141.1 CBS domain-containing protein [Nitrospirillum amazonense Y2]TWB47314.1 CBS domain-containing protein [Nitrospirillum amazonense]
MRAHDVMTEDVLTLAPDTPVSRIAALLLDRGVSAAPVVDGRGGVIGMVSEGDLINREEAGADHEARRDWWLALVAEGEQLPAYWADAQNRERTARDVMAAPVITVDINTDTADIARLLMTHGIKRVPVVLDGSLVGIVSRADLLKVLAAEPAEKTEPAHRPGLFQRWERKAPPAQAPVREPAHEPLFRAADFRHLVGNFHDENARQLAEQRKEALVRRQEKVQELIDHHVADHGWHKLLEGAHDAAARGEKEFLLLRFPAELCSDGARAINAPEPDWPRTLRGEAAEIYQRWHHELQPAGFSLTARVLDFPNGFPGDVGLFLVWGEAEG